MSFDISKAFDTVNRDILREKLWAIGIRDPLIKWLESYLSDRGMFIDLNGVRSDINSVKLGVPQGSVLGPLLFSIFMNDLPLYIKGFDVIMYADDFTVFLSSSDIESLNNDLVILYDLMSKWCASNKIVLNERRTVCLNFFNRTPLPEKTLGPNLNIVQCAKFLGTHLDGSLSHWSAQVDHVVGKLNSAFFAIMQLKSTLHQKALLDIYYALAYSHLSYNIVNWGSTFELNRIFIAQKRILRLIFGMSPLDSCKSVFKKHNLLTVPCL